MPPQHGPNRGRPTPGHPRVQRTRGHILAVARELLPEVGSAGLTYSLLADRAGVTRQTLYRHWPARAALLVDLILAGPEVGFPEPGSDPRAVATAWLTSLADQSGRGPQRSGDPRRGAGRHRPDRRRPGQRPGPPADQRRSPGRVQPAARAVRPSGHGPGVRTARRAGLRPAFLRPGRGHQRVHRHGGDRVVADPRPPLRSLRTRWGLGRGETSWGGWIWLIAGGSQAW